MLKGGLRVVQHGLAQGLAQIAALVTGILIVRALSKSDYAQYSLIVMLIPAIANVADSGIGAVFLSRGQAVRSDPNRLSQVYRIAMRQRWMLATPIVALSLVWLSLVLVEAGSRQVPELLIATAVLLIPTLNIGVLQVFHRVHMDVTILRRAIVAPALARLILTSIALATDAVSIWSMLVITFATTAANAVYLRRSARVVRGPRGDDYELTREFRSAIRKALPMTIAFVVTSQAFLGILAIKGSPAILAEYSAVSRFGLAFSLFLPIFGDLVAPSIARLPPIRNELVAKVGQAFGLCIVIVVASTTVVWLAKGILLSALGDGYQSLGMALVIVFFGYGLTFVGHAMGSVAQSRNWLDLSWTYVPMAVIWLLSTLLIPTISSSTEAAVLFVTQASLLVVVQVFRILAGIRSTPLAKGTTLQ